jgi:uncharacterized protein YndB with AHSA1/START domain
MTLETESEVKTLDIRKDVLIDASVQTVWDSVLDEIRSMHGENDQPMHMKLEAFPGGRWFRDLGEGVGHLWGHVQVIKPPKLLELTGPMFMSYPAVSHLQYRLVEEGSKTRLKLTHRAMGLIPAEHASGVQEGWDQILATIRKAAERKRR